MSSSTVPRLEEVIKVKFGNYIVRQNVLNFIYVLCKPLFRVLGRQIKESQEKTTTANNNSLNETFYSKS